MQAVESGHLRYPIYYLSMTMRRILLLAIPLLLVIGAVVAYTKLFNNIRTCRVNESGVERRCLEMVFSNTTAAPQRFTFKELGISLNILPRWSVERQTVESPEVNQTRGYVWIIQKKDGNGKLVLDSIRYASNTASICSPADMSPAKVTSVSETENPTLKYVTYTTTINNKEVHVPMIVRSDEKSFYRSMSSTDAISIASPGSYYVCTEGFALPGSNLRLGDFPQPFTGEWRQSISALHPGSSPTDWRPLSVDSSALPDISTMLKSIK